MCTPMQEEHHAVSGTQLVKGSGVGGQGVLGGVIMSNKIRIHTIQYNIICSLIIGKGGGGQAPLLDHWGGGGGGGGQRPPHGLPGSYSTAKET